MRELSQIRDAVVSALAAEGMAALDAYPDQRARRYGCPVAAVAVETAESRTVGFCNYLGEVFDTGAGAPRELYGKQLEAVISIEIRGLGGLGTAYTDNDIDLLVRGGVTPLESTAGTVSPVRGITTRTTTGGAADTTWRELTTILIVDDVIPAVRQALRSKFARAKNTAQSRSAIRSQVIVELEKKVAELEGELREGQEAIQENARLRELLGLQAKRQDLTFESAKVTARSADNWRSTLTLSKGEEAGLQPGNCVITSTGVLVGVVSKVGSHTATVSTVIDTSMEMGGIITRTNSAGVLEGDFSLMKEGRLKLSYLPDGAQLVAGDEVLTSGKGDVYPSGLVVGQVEGVFSDASGMNRYAVVAPEVELDSLVEVFVIKDFDIVE